MDEQANRAEPWQLNFTREQLGVMSEHSTNPLVADLSRQATRQLDKIEALELDAEDAREDIDSLDQHVVELRAKLESAEAERDILQWASDHSGGGGESGGGIAKARNDAENLTDVLLPRMLDLAAEIKSEANAFAMRAATKNLEGELADLTELEGECSCDLDKQKEDFFAGDVVEPERPHESLIWALYHAAAVFSADFHVADEEPADNMLEAWRARWPEPKA